jgi:hypothetical protein
MELARCGLAPELVHVGCPRGLPGTCERNPVACEPLHQKLGVQRRVARVTEPQVQRGYCCVTLASPKRVLGKSVSRGL